MDSDGTDTNGQAEGGSRETIQIAWTSTAQ